MFLDPNHLFLTLALNNRPSIASTTYWNTSWAQHDFLEMLTNMFSLVNVVDQCYKKLCCHPHLKSVWPYFFWGTWKNIYFENVYFFVCLFIKLQVKCCFWPHWRCMDKKQLKYSTIYFHFCFTEESHVFILLLLFY